MATSELNASTPRTFDVERHRRIVEKAIASKSFATLATSSREHRPHVSGVVYAAVDGDLYINTLDTSIKARNVRQNSRVAVCIPVRKLPIGPPYVCISREPRRFSPLTIRASGRCMPMAGSSASRLTVSSNFPAAASSR